LYEQFYNEKISLLNSAEKRMDVYYRAHVEGEINRLTRFELSVKRRIDEMTKVLRANRVSLQDEIYIKLEELRNLLNVKITKAVKKSCNRPEHLFKTETRPCKAKTGTGYGAGNKAGQSKTTLNPL